MAYTGPVPSRFGSPRGSIPRILREAGEIADARMRSVQKYLDDFTAADDPKDQVGGGGRLPRRDFVALLRQSPDFRQQIANRWAFANAKERETLLTVLREAFPAEMAAQVAQVPGGAIPPEQQGTGLGGPPQGAAPVGPQPAPGAAPPGVPGAGPPPPAPGAPPMLPPTMPTGPVLGAPPGPPAPPGMPPIAGLPAPGMAPVPGTPGPLPPQPLGLPLPGQGPLVPPVPQIGPASGPPGRPSLAAGLV